MPTSNSPSGSQQQSLFSQMCRAADFAPHVHPEESLAVTHSCENPGRRNVVTCADEYREEFVQEVGGLDISTVGLRGYAYPLETFVPVVPRGMFSRPASDIPSPVVGIMFNDILTKGISSRHGYYRFSSEARINTEILKSPVFQGKHVILMSSGQDVLIETTWWRRDELELFRTISGMGFLAVTGMNFSIFSGECPFSHALNTKKSLVYCQELDRLGVWTIPHIYAINPPQRERWRDWLMASPHIELITINTQLQRVRERDVTEVFETVRFLLENTSINVLLHGRGSGIPPNVRKRYEDRIYFAASGPLKSAVIRRDKSPADYIAQFVAGLAASS